MAGRVVSARVPGRNRAFIIAAVLLAALSVCAIVLSRRAAVEFQALADTGDFRFAVIGDFGTPDAAAAEVAALVRSWGPDLVITTGDNNYPDGAASTIDENIGQYYHSFISPYKGQYGAGADTNRFFPSLGNHDWETPGAAPYLDYFTLPGNERYYDFVRGPVHFFALDSDPREPDGIAAGSVQGRWLRQRLAASQSPWRLVYFHHPAYSSGDHGSHADMQWPFDEWGASVVMSGHDHDYERLLVGGLPYFVNGSGGRGLYDFHTPVVGSRVRYNADHGAMLVEANDTTITYRFINRQGMTIDTYAQCLPASGRMPIRPCLAHVWGGRSR
jgi:tartrate-resistant acid phosphatase type 5